MKTVMRNTLFLVIALLFPNSILSTVKATSAVMGTVRFPDELPFTPGLRVYSAGHIIPTTINEGNKEISFQIPKSRQQKQFYLIITDGVAAERSKKWDPREPHTIIEYLKVLPDHEYKLYQLELIHHIQENKHEWLITPLTLDERTGKIPDDAIIIYYDPQFVEKVEGGTLFQLPTVVIAHNLLAKIGSVEQVKELSDTLLISSIDLDTLHSTIKPQINSTKNCTIIATAIT